MQVVNWQVSAVTAILIDRSNLWYVITD